LSFITPTQLISDDFLSLPLDFSVIINKIINLSPHLSPTYGDPRQSHCVGSGDRQNDQASEAENETGEEEVRKMMRVKRRIYMTN
jgi:hypothetical protein